MKNYHLTFILAICVLIISFIIGGLIYIESEAATAAVFQKMTIQEKTMYDAVEKEWYEKELISIREAVGRRDIAPKENSTPFMDIANIIKTNNDITLTIEDKNNWNTDHKNRAIKCRWDRLDEDWYRKLSLSVGGKDYTAQELIPTEEKIIEDKSSIPKEEDLKYISNDFDEQQKSNVKDIIPESKYDDIFYKIRKCDEAIFMYKQIIDERLLTWGDYELLIKISVKCKAIQIGEKLTEWKN